jgi:hypothetical protein
VKLGGPRAHRETRRSGKGRHLPREDLDGSGAHLQSRIIRTKEVRYEGIGREGTEGESGDPIHFFLGHMA